MTDRFRYDKRLGILLPNLYEDWESLSPEERHAMIMEWEKIRARIPDRIMELEGEINKRQEHIAKEDDWDKICKLYGEIYGIASTINDLQIWSRIEQDFEPGADIAKEHESREK